MASWLMLACSYVKRQTEAIRLDDMVCERMLDMLKEIIKE